MSLPELKRNLTERERALVLFPRAMAKMHFKDIGEPMNPYLLGSLDGLDYVSEYQNCMDIFNQLDNEEF